MAYRIVVNQPGCLPEMEPYTVESIEAARDALTDELERSGSETIALERAREEVAEIGARGGSVEFAGYVHEIIPVACEDCFGNFIPGVRYPTAANEDDSREWIERCDVCERYPSDEAAAQALKRARVIYDYELARPEGSSTLTPFATPEEDSCTKT